MSKRKAVKKRSRVQNKVKKGPWQADEVGFLKKLFPNNLTSELAARLGRGTDAVKKKAARLGLRKSKRYLKKLGRA